MIREGDLGDETESDEEPNLIRPGGDEFSEVALLDEVPPMVRASPTVSRSRSSEFMAIMPPPDPYVSKPVQQGAGRVYRTGDDFVSYSDQPVERRVVVRRQKRPREETRAAERPRVQTKRTRLDPDPIYIIPAQEEFAYWPYLAFGTVLILLAYITEDPRAPSQ